MPVRAAAFLVAMAMVQIGDVGMLVSQRRVVMHVRVGRAKGQAQVADAGAERLYDRHRPRIAIYGLKHLWFQTIQRPIRPKIKVSARSC